MTDQGKRTAFLLALLMLCSSNAASQGRLQAGDHATAHGWGELRLGKARTPGQLAFDLQAVTSDHVCSITGLADAATGIALPSDADLAPGCILQLRAVADGVLVAAQDPAAEAACRYYCGANGSYDGLYLAITPACTWQALATAKATARAASSRAQRRHARAGLTPLLAQCTPTLNLEQAVDLHAVVAQLHAADGNGRACRAAMARYAEDASLDQDALVAGASPSRGRALTAAMAQVQQTLSNCPAR